MRKLLEILGLLGLFVLFSASVYARSGCCSWHDGVRADGCGCNDGTSLSATCAPYYTCTSSYTQPVYIAPIIPSCPSNAFYDSSSDKCVCNFGYTPNLINTTCVKIPKNASISYNGWDVWVCDYGYEEVGNSCVKKEEEIKVIDEIVKPKNVDDSTKGGHIRIEVENEEGFVGFMVVALGAGGYYWWKKRK